jgi:tryptophan-rich hypothetical protein
MTSRDRRNRWAGVMPHYGTNSVLTMSATTNSLHPKKLLHSKWTAVQPRGKEKHFMVVLVVKPALVDEPIKYVELQAVYSDAQRRIEWRELRDHTQWRQGWL